MDTAAYYRSLNTELFGLRDRVRHLLGGAHWPTDGGWKESVLRATLRRILGSAVEIGHGFFVNEHDASPQLDVMIYRSDAPVLFKDGTLAIVPASAVKAAIEVKTRLSTTTLREGLERLSNAARTLPPRNDTALGLFAYETDLDANRSVLEHLHESSAASGYAVDLVCNGPDRFIRLWRNPPRGGRTRYKKWHSYNLPEMAFGYFIHNIVSHLTPRGLPRSGQPFFPRPGKEPRKDGEMYIAGSINQLLESPRAVRVDRHEDI
jgi:hypothetical protein